MPADFQAPPFPSREALADFFRMDPRERVGVVMLARLLGASGRQVRRVLRSQGVAFPLDSVAWGEAAASLFDAWPRAEVIAALGSGLADAVPAAFRPEPVRLGIPLFILRAMEHQTALLRECDPRVNAAAADGRFTSPSVDDYIADILFNEIRPGTVADLSHDASFARAYHYPPLAD